MFTCLLITAGAVAGYGLGYQARAASRAALVKAERDLARLRAAFRPFDPDGDDKPGGARRRAKRKAS